MKIQFIKNIEKAKANVLVLPIFKSKKFDKLTEKINAKLDDFITKIIRDGYFEPNSGQVHMIYPENKTGFKKIVLLGMGEKKEITDEIWLENIAKAILYIGQTKIGNVVINLGEKDENQLRNIAEATMLAMYKFHHYKSKKDNNKLNKIEFLFENKNLSDKKILELAKLVLATTQGIYLSRDLGNHPSNYINPSKMAELASDMADNNIKVRVFSENQLKKMQMGLMTAVSMGAKEDAKMIVLDYLPKKYSKTIVLVGKGLTYDSGGYNLKPSTGGYMDLMKLDMAGAGAVMGLFEVLKKIKPKNIRVIGAIGAVENLPGHEAQKPGDIWKSFSGKTVEVLNTDAEGRLVLADVISYVQKTYKPDYLIDIATLTGACMLALGSEYAGLFSNDSNLIKDFKQISNNSYEKTWNLPINDKFREEVKGELADLKNIGNGTGAGASTAAAFLESFVDKKVKWAHLDIAGTAIISKSNRSYIQRGGSGFGVRTLMDLIFRLD